MGHFDTPWLPTQSLLEVDHGGWHNAASEILAFPGAAGDLRIYNVLDYDGVDPTGLTDSTVGIQAAVDDAALTGGILFFPPGLYLVSASIILPGAPAGLKRLLVSGYGATITTTAAISMMKRNFPTDMTDAVNMLNYQFHFEGLNFLGNSTTGQVGLDLVGTYGATLRDMWYEDCDTGQRLTFCLEAKVESCLEKRCVSYGFHARSGNGLWSGASIPNSGSNHTAYRSCRSYGRTGELAQFYAQGCSGMTWDNVITEGENPVNGILIDDEASTVSKYHRITNHHSENTPSGTVIRAKIMGVLQIDGLWHQTDCLMIDATDSNASSVIDVSHLPWTPATPAYKGGGTWLFSYSGSGGTDDPTAAARWDGAVPTVHSVGVRPSVAGTELHTATVRAPAFTVPTSGGIGLFLEGNAHGAVLYSNDPGNYATKWGTAGDDPFGAVRAGVLGSGDIKQGAGLFHEFLENGAADAGAGAANTARLYCRDNGAGKTQLCVRFATGAVQVIATEP